MSPSVRYTPHGISQKALPVWEGVIRKYADQIFSDRIVSRQWSTAISLFERQCKSRGIQPYSNLAKIAEGLECLLSENISESSH